MHAPVPLFSPLGARAHPRPERFLFPRQLCSTSCRDWQLLRLSSPTTPRNVRNGNYPSHAPSRHRGMKEATNISAQLGPRFIKLSESRNAKRLQESREWPRKTRERLNERMIPCQFNETIARAREKERRRLDLRSPREWELFVKF